MFNLQFWSSEMFCVYTYFFYLQVGTLRFCGSTEFSGGLWAGVELDRPEGKNDGSVAGVQYFTCRLKHGGTRHVAALDYQTHWLIHFWSWLAFFSCAFYSVGIFAPLSKISKPLEKHKSGSTKTPLRPPRRIDGSRIASKINTGKKKEKKAAQQVCLLFRLAWNRNVHE